MHTYKNRKPIVLLILLAAALTPLLAGFPVCAADNDKITIEGTEFLEMDLEALLFRGSGNITVKGENLELTGDKLVYDEQNQLLFLEGNVTLSQGDAYMEGESLVYNIAEERGEIVNGTSYLISEKIEGTVFVYGEHLRIDSGDYFIEDGRISACDLSEPHYHLAVKKIDIYPGEKMVIHGVRFYEGKMPLFYWPYLVIPLDDRYDEDFTLPEIGYNAEDGYYFKHRYKYHLSPNAHGSLIYEYYTRKGLGLGVDHKYDHDTLGGGGIALYLLPFAASKYFVGQLQHEYEAEGIRFSTNNSYTRQYVDQVLEQNIASSTSVSYQAGGTRLTASFNYGLERKGEESSRTWSASGSWRQQLLPNWMLDLSSKAVAKDETTTYDHLAETSYTYNNHRFSLAVQQKYNPDLLDEAAAPTWKSLNRLPEVTWQWTNPSLLGLSFPGRFQLSAGRFEEYPSGVATWRVVPALELFSRSWRSDFGTTVTYSGNVSSSFYGSGQSLNAAYGRVGITQKLTDTTSVTANYYKRLVWGETPFRFDRQTAQDLLRGTLRYTKRPWTVTVNTGYDFLKDRYETLRTQVNFSSATEPVTAGITLNYDINNRRFGDLSANINYKPKSDWVFSLGVVYNIQNKQWKRINGKIQFDLAEDVSLSYDLNYEPTKASNKLKQGKLTVTFDLHCRKLEMSYDQVRKEFRVQYSINAFPKLPIGYSTQEGIRFFKIEDLKDLIGNE